MSTFDSMHRFTLLHNLESHFNQFWLFSLVSTNNFEINIPSKNKSNNFKTNLNYQENHKQILVRAEIKVSNTDNKRIFSK